MSAPANKVASLEAAAVNDRAVALRNKLIDTGDYHVAHLVYLRDLQEIEDDGFESITSKALSMLIDTLTAEARRHV